MTAFIDEFREEFGVEPICRALPIAPSACARGPRARPRFGQIEGGRRPCRVEIARLWQENRGLYGARRIWHALRREGMDVARCTVERLMKAMGIKGVVRGRRIVTINPDASRPCPDDKVNRQFKAERPNRLSTTDTVPMVRVPWSDQGILMKVLDAGAYGVICPMVNSRAEAEAMVQACRYPPLGGRSFGPARAALYAGADYAKKSNETVVVMPMIETREAVENMDAILSTPGVDGVYVGPADLGLSHGYVAKGDRDELELVEIIHRIAQAAARHGKIAGIHCGTPAYARGMIDLGYRFVTVQADSMLLGSAARRAVELTRHGEAQGSGGGLY